MHVARNRAGITCRNKGAFRESVCISSARASWATHALPGAAEAEAALHSTMSGYPCISTVIKIISTYECLHIYQYISTYISIYQYILIYFNCIADVLLNEFINNLISTLSTYINIFIIFQRISPV